MIGEDIYLSTFGKHVPRILEHQLISKLTNQYLAGETKLIDNVDSIADIDGDSSIIRFHSAMLFVDISGFTVLSQRLKVDDLKVQINNYFELIVGIILKYDGEIIKFAGDAIFVIFQTKVNSLADPNFHAECKQVVDTAVVCGKEVLEKCGHYPVQLGKDNAADAALSSMQLFDSAGTGMVSTKSTSVKVKTPKSTAAPATAESNVTYLDVHCGVSVGTMAGIDVGAAGRFEYLILGPPMAEVAIAEGDAGKGELVITPGAHAYLHRYAGPSLDGEQTSTNGTDLKNKPQASPKREAPQVGEEGASCFCFGRRTAPQVHPSNSNTSGTTQASDSPNGPLRTKPAAPTTDTYNDVPGTKLPCGCTVTPSGFFLIDSNPKAPFDTKIGRTRVPKTLVQFAAKEILSDVSKSFEVIRSRVGDCDSQLKSWKDAPVATRQSVVSDHYLRWARDCLVEDVAMHVHEAARGTSDYLAGAMDRTDTLSIFLSSAELAESLRVAQANDNKNTASGGVRADPFAVLQQGETAEALQTTSELRNVIVMFINIHMDNSELLFDPSPFKYLKTCPMDEFHFLTRTEKELSADQALRDKFQNCFAVMAQTFSDKGGQVRQFIVDDKGTVCIGTFGLRGAVNYDNAAASMEAAELILSGLQAIGIGASIGLTSGQAYCGLVGSTFRHEYAVMGPSINLSARLMGRAAKGEAICDAETRSRDRVHNFITMGAVQAKGYAQPVPTFKPSFNLFQEVAKSATAPDLTVSIKQVNKLGKKQLTKKGSFLGQAVSKLQSFRSSHRLQGRDENIERIVRFLPARDADAFKKNFFDSLKSGATPSTTDKNAISEVFNATLPARLVGLVGPHGIGKTALLDLFQDQLIKLSTADPAYNIQVFRHRIGYINSSAPFSAWMCMLFHMMFYLALHYVAHEADDETRANTVVGFNNLSIGIEYVFRKLTPELQRLRPLLCDVGMLPPEPDNEHTARLKGTERLYRTADLLAAYIQQHSVITGKLTFMIMDDIQNNDAVSQYLLRKVWNELTGVALLTTYRPKSKDKDKSATSGGSTPGSVRSRATSTSRTSSSDLGRLEIPLVDFLTYMDESDSFKRVDLQVISQEANRALVDDIFELFDITITDADDVQTVYRKMFALSGGNPLYTAELAKGIAQKRAAWFASIREEEEGEEADPVPPSLIKLLEEMRPARVEEVVYFRFDQLDPAWQTILKLAAMAASNGAPFTVPMLQFLLANDKSLSAHTPKNLSAPLPFEDNDLASTINYILSTGEFIYIKNMSLATPIVDRGNAHIDFNTDVLNSLSLSWHISMEQRAIYELMLDEQKISLHATMAKYLQTLHPSPDITALHELAHHQSLSRDYAGALRSYHQSGSLLHAKGDDRAALSHFTAAQRMVSQLRAAAGVNDHQSQQPQPGGFKGCTLEQMQAVFGHDGSLVDVAVRTLLRLAESLLIFTRTCEDAQLTTLAHRNARVFLEQATTMLEHLLHRSPGAESKNHEKMVVDFDALVALFWECFAASSVQVPQAYRDTESSLEIMVEAIAALKASVPASAQLVDEAEEEA